MTAVPWPEGVMAILHVEVVELTLCNPPQPPPAALKVAVLLPSSLKRTSPEGVSGLEKVSSTKTVQAKAWFTDTLEGEQKTTDTVGSTTTVTIPETRTENGPELTE